MTVLFADICGYTRLAETLDAEEVHGIVQAYFDRLERIVVRRGGVVERYIGDAVMCVFGAPIAHMDDALRAVRAAVAIQEAMPDLSRELGQALQSTVGVATGEVVVMGSRADYAAEITVVGQSVNLAARIDGLAKPGEILISGDLHQQVSEHIEATCLGAHVFKGISTPTRVWRVTGLSVQRSTETPPLMGRQKELSILRGQLERAARDAVGSVVALRGAPGIGKSHLLRTVESIADQLGIAVHRAGFLDFGLEKTTEGLAALTASLLGVSSAEAEARRRGAAESCIASGRLADPHLPLLYELLAIEQSDATLRTFGGMDRETREQRLRGTLAELVQSTSRERPLLLVIEDVHWAEPLVANRLAALGARISKNPVVLLMATRIAGDPFDDDFDDALEGTPITRITLDVLDPDAMEGLAKRYANLHANVVQHCIHRSEGNPLFLEQLLRHAAEGEDGQIPDSLRSVVLSRVDRLEPKNRLALQAASVIGQRWQVDGLQHVLEDPGYHPRPLLDSQLVRQEPSSFLFAHALLHEGVYSSLLKRHASALHRRAATWFAGRDPMIHAQHLDRAGDRAAIGAYLESATADIDIGRYERAQFQLARAFELAPGPEDYVQLGLQRGRLLHDLGDIPGSAHTFRAVLARAQDDVERCRAWIGLAASMRVSDDIDGAFAVLEDAQHAAERHGLDAERARIHYLRGSLLFPRADIDGCLREHQLALEHARRSGATRCEAEALSGLGDALYASGRMQSAYGYFRQCMALCQESGFGRLEAANRFMVGTVRFYLHELGGALADSLESADLALQVGNRRAEIISRLTAGWVLLSLGKWAESERQARTGLEVARSVGAQRFVPFLSETLARVAWFTDQPTEARTVIGTAVDQARELNMMRFIGPWLLGTLAMTDADRRDDALEEGWAILESGAVGHNHYHFHAHGIEAELDAGRPAAVERHAAALEAFTREQPNPWANFRIQRARTLAAHLEGKPCRQALIDLDREGRQSGLVPALFKIQGALQGQPPP